MSEHAIEWSPDTRTPEPAIATAADTIEARLPALSDDTNRVLRSSQIAPGSFETLVNRLTDDERHALIRMMQ